MVEGEGEAARAVGVRLADGRVYRGRTVVSNATRWDTFEGMIGADKLPESGAPHRARPPRPPARPALCSGRCWWCDGLHTAATYV